MAGLLDALGRGLAYGSKEATQNRADQRELDNYEKKLRLAQKLTEEVEQRKRELAKSFPEVEKTYTTPWGVTGAIMTDGSVKEIAREQDVYDAFVANKNASAIRAQNDTTLTPHKAGLLDAKTNAANVGAEQAPIRTEIAGRKVDKANDPKAPKPITPTAGRTAIAAMDKALLEEIGGYEETRAGKLKKLSPKEKQAMVDAIISKNPAIWADYMQAMGQVIAPSAEAATPASVPSSDISSALDPTYNHFKKKN